MISYIYIIFIYIYIYIYYIYNIIYLNNITMKYYNKIIKINKIKCLVIFIIILLLNNLILYPYIHM